MSHVVLWIDLLLISLLWPLGFDEWLGRRPRQWIRLIIAGGLSSLTTLALLGIVTETAFMRFKFQADHGWFRFFASLLAVHMILRIAWHLARRGVTGRSTHLTLLATSLLIAVALGGVTLEQMDQAVRVRCEIRSSQAQALYVANLPPLVPGSVNAADLYSIIFARLKADAPSDLHNPPLGDAETFDPHEPATHAFLARQADTITMLHRAATQPCRYDQDLGPPTMDIEQKNPQRVAADVLGLHAKQALADGDVASAIQDANASLFMGQQFGERPLLISALVGIGFRSLGISELEEALPNVTESSQLGGLDFDAVDSPGKIYREAMLGEERFGLEIYAGSLGDWSLGKMSGSSSAEMYSQMPMATLLGRNFLFDVDAYVRLIEQVRAISPKPYFQARPQIEALLAPNPTSDLLANLEASSLARSLQTLADISAREGCARVAVAMMRYRLDHGALPDSLTELTPAYLTAAPADPFDGKPLRLALRDGDRVIYSVGEDGVDDGGTDYNHHGKGDILFTLHARPTNYSTTRP